MLARHLFSRRRPAPQSPRRPQQAPAPHTQALGHLDAALLGTPTCGQAHALAGYLLQGRPSSSISTSGSSAAPPTSSGCSTTERPPLPETDADDHLSEDGDKEDDGDGIRDKRLVRVVAADVVNKAGQSSYSSALPNAQHVVYTLTIRYDIEGKGIQKGPMATTIATRWSAVRGLHLQLAKKGRSVPAAPGYTQAIAALVPSAPSLGEALLSAGRSCLDPSITLHRASCIERFLNAVLAEPLLRSHPAVQSFLAEGRRQHLTSQHKSCPVVAGAAAANAKPAVVASSSSPSAAGNDQREQQDVQTPEPVAGKISPSSLKAKMPAAVALQQESATTLTFRLLMETGTLAPFLTTQDLQQLSLCCSAHRPFTGQITSLQPRAASEAASIVSSNMYVRVEALQEGLQRLVRGNSSVTARALRASTLRRQAAQRTQEDQAWDFFFDELEAGRVLRQLEQLDLGCETGVRRGIPMAPALRLASALRYLPGLRDLDLSSCHIGSQGAVALAEGLRHTPRLRWLSLQGTKIGDAGVVAVAGALPHLPELQVLRLGNCGMRAVGAQALAQQLKHATQLKVLDVRGIEGRRWSVRKMAIDAILFELHHLSRLESLYVGHSCLSYVGALSLASIFPSLPALRTLDVEDCMIGDKGLHAIACALKYLPDLRSINIRGNRFGRKSERARRFLMSCLAKRGPFVDEDEDMDTRRSAAHPNGQTGLFVRVDMPPISYMTNRGHLSLKERVMHVLSWQW